jgi:hypothetical protein
MIVEMAELSLAVLVFIGLGFLINKVSNSAYWMWVDWKNRDK